MSDERERELDRRIRQLQLADPALSYRDALLAADKALTLERTGGVDDSHTDPSDDDD
jgi:hypothetical protein